MRQVLLMLIFSGRGNCFYYLDERINLEYLKCKAPVLVE